MSLSSWPPRTDLDHRCMLMVDVTLDTLRFDPDLRLCEGLRLIAATRDAVARLAPGALQAFEISVVPEMREILLERFGVCPPVCQMN